MMFKFASQGISLCFTAVKIKKRVTRDKKFLRGRSFVWFSGPVSSFLKYQKYFKHGSRKFHFPKYKKSFQSGFFFVLFFVVFCCFFCCFLFFVFLFLFFELGELLPEITCFLKYILSF